MNLKKYIGETFYGYCNGYFGRDSYEDKTVVYAGRNYLLCEDEYKHPHLAVFQDESNNEITRLIESWMTDSDEY